MPVEQLRTFLIIGLCLVTFLMWQAWLADYAPKPTRPASTATPERSEGAPPEVASTEADIPQASDTPAATQAETGTDSATVPQTDAAEAPAGARIRVKNDVVAIDITLAGGTLERIELLQYPVATDRPDEPFTLFNPTLPNVFIGQTGLLGENVPNHHAQFTAERDDYLLADDANTLEVPLRWEGPDGLAVTKTFTLERNSYAIGVRFDIDNTSEQPWSGQIYGQFQRTQVAPEGGLFRIYTYTGGVLSSEEKPYEKIDFSDMAELDLSREVKGGWAAMIQHYFVGAWVPKADVLNRYYTKTLPGARYILGVVSAPETIAAGAKGQLSMLLYAGPKTQDRMKKLAPHLERTVDFGYLWFIAQPLFLLLKWIHSYVGNWGWAIIIVTLLIKLAFFHLSATSYKSMARMRKLQPRITALRDRYQDDKQRMNQAMMQLYKEEKINPLGGCLPILVQIPVFIALYWVLVESVELRQTPFILWLQDLSVHDPYFVLPVLMGITMLAQQKLNPAPPDPVQAKVMMALPFVFTFFFLFFPAGLVLYWFVNNLLSIAQQWVITKKIVGSTTT